MLRPVRTVRVTTKAELDAALGSGSADQVIVEGDDRLLSYAASKASSDPDNNVSVEIGEHSVAVGQARASANSERTVTRLPNWGRITDSGLAAHPPAAVHLVGMTVRRRTRRAPLFALLILLVAFGGGGLLWWHWPSTLPPRYAVTYSPPAAEVQKPPAPTASPPPLLPPLLKVSVGQATFGSTFHHSCGRWSPSSR
jgi:hypothetical protein